MNAIRLTSVASVIQMQQLINDFNNADNKEMLPTDFFIDLSGCCLAVDIRLLKEGKCL